MNSPRTMTSQRLHPLSHREGGPKGRVGVGGFTEEVWQSKIMIAKARS